MSHFTPIPPQLAAIYRLLLQALPGVTIMAFDTALTCLVVEGKFFEILGIAAPYAVGAPLSKIMRGESADTLLPQYQAALRGEINDYEHVVDSRFYHVRVLPVRDDTGQIVAGVHIIHDITAQKRADETLRESVQRYRSVVTALAEGIVMQTATGEIQACNPAAERILGLTPDQMTGRTSIDPRWQSIHEDGSIFPGETHPAMVTLRTGEPLHDVIMGIHKPDGALTWISINSQPLTRDGESLPYAVVTTFTDITERKRMSDQLAQSERYYRQLFGNNSAVQLLIDPDSGYVVQASDAACRYYGYTAEQMKTLHVSDINTLSKAEMEAQMALARQEQRDYLYFKHRLSSGEIRDVNVFSGPVELDGKTYLHSVVQDVTERRKTQEALRDSENTIRALVEQSHEGIMITDNQGLITEWNAAIEAMTGLPRRQALGQPVWTIAGGLMSGDSQLPIMHEWLKQDNLAILNANLAEPSASIIEREIVRTDGTLGVIQVTRFRIQSAIGKHLVGITRDITEQRRMLDALAASEAKFRSFVEQSSDAITLVDSLGFVIEWNKAREDMTGLKREEVLGKFYWDVQSRLIPPEHRPTYDLAQVRERVWEALRNGHSALLNRTVEAEVYTTNGTRKYIRQTIFAIQSGRGRILASVSVDITKERQTFAALTASEEKFRAFVEQSSDGITLIDGTGRVVEWNAAHEGITGLRRDEVLGQFFWDVLFRLTPPQWQDKRHYEAAKADVLAALEDDQAPLFKKSVEGGLFAGNNNHRIVQQRIFPVRSGSGFLIGSISRDITEDKLAERRAFDLALEKERVQLLQIFIRQASHEFRTPLAIINSAAFFAANAESLEKRQSKADMIEAQVWRMIRLVEMLLTMTQLESNVERALSPININQIIHNVHRKMVLIYGDKPEFHENYSADSPIVLADAEELTEAVLQLLDNAHRFTPPDGIITVSTSVEKNQVYLKISDTGPGISAEHLSHIFETFWRQDQSHTTPGFGLGLPIVKKIIEKFGGSVTVESELTKGSTFRVVLPMAISRHDQIG